MEETETKPPLAKRIFYYPVTRIILGIIVCLGTVAISNRGLYYLLIRLAYVSDDLRHLILNLAVPLVALLSYTLLYKYYEKRSISELKLSALPGYGLLGATVGIGLQALVVLVIYLFGGYHIIQVNPISYLLPSLLIGISSGVFEEILFRGIIFRIIQEKWGSVVGLIVSAVLFGAVHLMNKNSTLYSAFAIAIEAGILLCACYMFSSNLWLPIGLHFGWNFAEAGIFGAVLSGNTIDKTLITAKFTGSQYLSGGDFGPENSIPAIIICTAAGVVFLWLAGRKNTAQGLLAV
jgi:uncharacterized protein